MTTHSRCGFSKPSCGAIYQESLIREANVVALRSGENIGALLRAAAMFMAMSPTAMRSPATIRDHSEQLRKRLTRLLKSTEESKEFHDFMEKLLETVH